MNIAVLLTTFNRKEKTLACLRCLENQQLPKNVSLHYYLTDDNSKDGTKEAVKNLFPKVNVYDGNGYLFWAGGMRNTWTQALPLDPDYYLLLNDDTVLKPNAIASLIQCSIRTKEISKKEAICIGSTSDDESGLVSYGGRRLNSKESWDGGFLVYSDTDYLSCDFAHANILLVPNEIVKNIGILSDKFTHGLADYDYTLKAKKAGYDLIVAPGFLGSCVDETIKNWKTGKVSLKERIAFLKSPKGLAYKEFLGYVKEHFPKSYYPIFIKLWMKTLFPFIWDTFKK